MNRFENRKKIKVAWRICCFILIFISLIWVSKETVQEVLNIETSRTTEYIENPRNLKEWQEINPKVVMVLEFNSDGKLHNIPVLEVENGDKYMKRNLWGSYDSMGSVFIEKEISPIITSNNWIINGHSSYKDNMGITFLRKYSKQEYLTKNSTFQIEMEDGFHVYQVVGFYEYDYKDGEENLYFGWYNNNFTKEEAMEMFKLNQPFNISRNQGVDFEGQQMVTIITCNMQKADSRYVLMAIEMKGVVL